MRRLPILAGTWVIAFTTRLPEQHRDALELAAETLGATDQTLQFTGSGSSLHSFRRK
jgi:hypothetical protein